MLPTVLSEDNFLLFAARHYDSSTCTGLKEFYEDLSRIKYIKGLIKRYQTTGKLSERLLLNHFISLHNVFGTAIVPMLFFRTERHMWSQIKTFLVFLDYLKPGVMITSEINESDIPLDTKIINTLRGI